MYQKLRKQTKNVVISDWRVFDDKMNQSLIRDRDLCRSHTVSVNCFLCIFTSNVVRSNLIVA